MAAAVAAAPLAYTISTALVPHREVSVTWRVEGLTAARIKSAEENTPVRSPAFALHDRQWRLELYAAGCYDCSARNTAVVCLAAADDLPSSALFDFTLAACGLSCANHAAMFYRSSNMKQRRCLELPHAVLLFHSARSPNGALVITATLRKSGDATVNESLSALPVPLAPLPATTLAAALAALQHDESSADVTLLCNNNERLQAHSLLLCARSPVLKAQLTGPLACDARALHVPDDIAPAIMRRLLSYVYTDALTPQSPEEAQHLLHAADHYDLPGLRAVCESALCAALSVDTAAFTLTLADQHGAAALRAAALAFAAAHAVAVMGTDGWAHLKEARPSLVDALIQTMATGAPPHACG
jgi:hypothetical protein